MGQELGQGGWTTKKYEARDGTVFTYASVRSRPEFKLDSDRLFRAAWRKYWWFVSETAEYPYGVDDVVAGVYEMIGYAVNNSRSNFYIHG